VTFPVKIAEQHPATEPVPLNPEGDPKTLVVFLNGQAQMPGVAYEVNYKTGFIDFTGASPQAGDSIQCSYTKWRKTRLEEFVEALVRDEQEAP